MSKLTGQRLDFCSLHIERYNKMTNGRRLYVKCDTKSAGEKVYGYLKAAYDPKSYDKGFNWRDFTLVFKDTYSRDAAFADMDAAIVAYREAHPLPPPSSLSDLETTDEDPVDTSDTPTTDWTTSIGIGAAAVVIAIILFTKRKKR